MKKRKRIILAFLALLLVLVAACSPSGKMVDGSDAVKITVYKSPTCGCCGGYVSELKRQGFDVEVIQDKDINQIKDEYGIPADMRSCHTSIVGDYFVEGHVPIEAVMRLVEEKPQIDGIMLPGMPAGATGMPGAKRGAFRISALADGEVSEFMSV